MEFDYLLAAWWLIMLSIAVCFIWIFEKGDKKCLELSRNLLNLLK